MSQPTADDHAQFFSEKIGQIRASTAAAAPPVIEDSFIAEPLSVFRPATSEEIVTI
jgi:hypothetical protein